MLAAPVFPAVYAHMGSQVPGCRDIQLGVTPPSPSSLASRSKLLQLQWERNHCQSCPNRPGAVSHSQMALPIPWKN